jgi:hypothetical protein
MLSLQAAYALESDAEFQGRAIVAFKVVAHEVLAESPDTPNYDLRVNHANLILQRPASTILGYVGGVIASPAIQQSDGATITDDQILEGVRQVWDNLIGLAPRGLITRPLGASQ